MTTEQGFRLATRTLVVFSLFWLVSELLYLPTDFIGFTRHLALLRVARVTGGNYVADEAYWVRYYLQLVCRRIIMASLSLWMATYFYRGGAGLRRFFFLSGEASND